MRLIIVDDDYLVVNSLKTIVEARGMEVLATGFSGREAIELYKEYRPDLILLDIRMEDLNGIEATEEILKYHKEAKILLITTFKDKEYIEKAISLGSRGYILKENISGIIPAIEGVYANNIVFDSQIISNITSFKEAERVSLEELSERENELVELLAEGLNNKEIAQKLFLSEGTVRNYISRILEKLQLRDRTQLAIYYFKNK